MEGARGPLPLPDLARLAHCSTRQLQRDFAEVLGIAPRQYGAAVRTAAARAALQGTASVTDAMYDAGYGSVRAFYSEAAKRLGMAPREYAERTVGRVLLWSTTATSLGDVVAVASPDGLCAVRIGAPAPVLAELHQEFAGAQLQRDEAAMRDVMAALRQLARGLDAPRLPVATVGTAFQARVWAALQEIPSGQIRSYTQIARSIGSPRSVRAVARACATNPVALAVPCHRVIRADGDPAGYRWGLAVKVSLLDAERAAVPA